VSQSLIPIAAKPNARAHALMSSVNRLKSKDWWLSVMQHSSQKQYSAEHAISLQWEVLAQSLQKRDIKAHKGDFGHVLVIGGDHGFAGAVRLAAEAALRVGAGLVSVVTHKEHLSVVNDDRPEIMCHSTSDLSWLLRKATVIVLGPGLGKSAWSKKLFRQAIAASQPKVIDADALNLLSEKPRSQSHWILTPHAGEAARLLGCTSSDIERDRLHAVKSLVKKYSGVAVLKGHHTLIQDAEEGPFVCHAGNPGMASGGMGDVLSGVIAGLLAQHFSLLSAAKTGVMLHALAGDEAAKQGERGLLASDLFLHLRRWVNP